MNIGIVTTWFERGASYVSKQFEDVLSQKHDVYIYARGGERFAKGDPKWDKPNVYWSQYLIEAHYIDKKEFLTWLHKNSIDVVLFNEQHFFEPVMWCKEVGVKTIAYIDYYTEETLPLFKIYDSLICNTKRHYSAFDEHPGANYVPWGTNIELYRPKFDDCRLVEEDKVIFFNSAGMNPLRKGADTFIRALALCKNKRVKGLIHSQKDLKSFFPELADTIRELEQKGMLELVEKTVPAPGLYYKGDVYVYPSILDGIGLTVAEALSSGLACIVSDNPPMNEFVTEETGSLIPITRLYSRADGYYWPQCRCDVEALAIFMDQYANKIDKLIEKKINARKYAVEHLSFESNATRIFGIIEQVKIREVDSKLIYSIKEYDKKKLRPIPRLILRYKLHNLPILKKFISHQGATENK